MPTAEGDGEVSGVVDGGEEEHDTVALVPSQVESFFRLALVEACISPGADEVCSVAAAARGGCYEPDHVRLPETTNTALSAARRCRLPTPFILEVCRKVVSTSRPQSSRSWAPGMTRSRVTRANTTARRALTADSLTISSKAPPLPPTKTASGSGRSRRVSGAMASMICNLTP